MDNKVDFLSRLRLRRQPDGEVETLKNPSDLRLRIVSKKYGVELSLITPHNTIADCREYDAIGAKGPLVKALTGLLGKSEMDFNWTGSDNPDDSFYIADYPFLAAYIPKWADSLADANGEPIQFNPEKQKVTLRITDKKKNSNSQNGELTPKFYAGDEKVKAFVGDTYALTDFGLLTVASVGDRFADLMAFASPFDAYMAESFLSIFFSSANNIDVDFGGRKVKRIDDPVTPVPNLIIEKVDEDNSLYLKVTETSGNLPPEICDNFRISRIVTLTDKDIFVRNLGESQLEHGIEILNEALTKGLLRRESKQIWQEGNLFVVPQEIASKFLYNSFAGLLTTFRLLGAEKLKSYKIVAAKPKLSLKLSSGIDYLEGKANVEIGGQEFSLRDLLAQYGKNRYVTLSDGNRAVLDETYMKRLERIFRNNAKKGDGVQISFFDLPEVMELLDEKAKESKSFANYRKFYEGFNALAEKKLSTPKLKAKLRDYQKEGVKWIDYLYSTNMGGCLADDMGLGKTVQTIAMLTKSVPKATKPTLIVMPRSLLFNWQEEMRKFAPGIKVTTHYGSNRNLAESLKGEVVLTTYAIVRSDIEEMMKTEFDYVILDESQNIKNVDAMMTKAVWLLKADHRLALSGTPIENNLSELYSLFHFLNPAMFGSLQDFTSQYAVPIQRTGDEETAMALRRKVFPFILRRLKSEVLSDLPERTDQVLMVDMSPRQAALYEERRRYFSGEIEDTISREGVGKASFLLLQALSELRQIASVPEEKSDGAISSPKIDLLMEYLTSAVKNGHKVVVFFNFLAGIELTGERLDRENIGYETMTGATRDRKKAVERFQNDDDCRVMLMTVKTGGVGLNLVAADTVFIMEPWWNKAAEEQAINRLHRIGQKKSVNCYYLITADTIEEKIRLLQEKKSALVDSIISSDSGGGKNLSPEDISYLLS